MTELDKCRVNFRTKACLRRVWVDWAACKTRDVNLCIEESDNLDRRIIIRTIER